MAAYHRLGCARGPGRREQYPYRETGFSSLGRIVAYPDTTHFRTGIREFQFPEARFTAARSLRRTIESASAAFAEYGDEAMTLGSERRIYANRRNQFRSKKRGHQICWATLTRRCMTPWRRWQRGSRLVYVLSRVQGT